VTLSRGGGVFDEIATHIDASGRKANIGKLIRNILSRFPDVAETRSAPISPPSRSSAKGDGPPPYRHR
jgi:hypothetical protein